MFYKIQGCQIYVMTVHLEEEGERMKSMEKKNTVHISPAQIDMHPSDE